MITNASRTTAWILFIATLVGAAAGATGNVAFLAALNRPSEIAFAEYAVAVVPFIGFAGVAVLARPGTAALITTLVGVLLAAIPTFLWMKAWREWSGLAFVLTLLPAQLLIAFTALIVALVSRVRRYRAAARERVDSTPPVRA